MTHPEQSRDHYWSRSYNTKARICSYWHQADEVLAFHPQTVLEAGPGAGIVTDWLRRTNVSVTTLDSDPAVEPDVVGSVTALPFASSAFDVVICCQVLEHMPYGRAETALQEIRRVARRGAVISIPDSTPWAGLSSPLYHGVYIRQLRSRLAPGRRGKLSALIRRDLRIRERLFLAVIPDSWGLGGRTWSPSTLPIPHGDLRPEPNSAHRYEIGMRGYPLQRIHRSLAEAGLEVERTFRVPENPWHHFFICR